MTELKSLAHVDWPYEFSIVPISQMEVDDRYQRDLTDFVDEIEAEFNPALVGTLCLSKHGAKKYTVIDGQTRMVGAARRGVPSLPGVVFSGLSLEQEAELFALFQTKRRGMHSSQRFHAQRLAGYKIQVAVDEIVRAAGFKVGQQGKKPEVLAAPAALEWVYKGARGNRVREPKVEWEGAEPETLMAVLHVIRQAWGPEVPETAKGAIMLRGMGQFIHDRYKAEQPLNEDRLIARLRKVTPTDLQSRAEAVREGKGLTTSSPKFLAEAINNVYEARGGRY